MSEQIREQVSAFLDGELPDSETELLLKRLTRDAELRESFGRYALIGESLRGATRAPITRGFAGRVNSAIDGEPAAPGISPVVRARAMRWWRPAAGVAVAAGVAAVAVVTIQHRVTTGSIAQNQGPIIYATPTAHGTAVPAVLPAARLTNYVFAHSRYSSVLGQSNVLAALLTDADEQQAVLRPAAAAPPSKDAAIAP